MNFDLFLLNYKADSKTSIEDFSGDVDSIVEDSIISAFITKYEGCSFNGGMYRLHCLEDINKWNKIIFEIFPKYKEKICCFAYDWLGRIFAVYGDKISSQTSKIFMFEPGTGKVLEIPVNFFDFHNIEAVQYKDALFASSFFQNWQKSNPDPIKHEECIGYKVPLFLNGKDEVSNLESINLEIYWVICGQLINKTRVLPAGATIRNISIND